MTAVLLHDPGETASPSPEVSPLPLKPGSKMCSMWSGRMPHPVSENSTICATLYTFR